MKIQLSALVLFSTLGLAACGSANVLRLAHGGYRITCDKGMSDCVSRADKICSGKGYTILRGQNSTRVLGGASSNYKAPVYLGDLEIVCGAVKVTDPKCEEPEGKEETVHQLFPAESGGRVCVPGSTQACVGPGACSGGQVCGEDGKGYGSCDCGGAPTSNAAEPGAVKEEVSPSLGAGEPPAPPAPAHSAEPL